jgi:hypothetical protein
MITLIGLDLGQQNDYTAISVVEATPTIYEQAVAGRDTEFNLPALSEQLYESTPVSYAVRHLERMLGAPYPEVVRRIIALTHALDNAPLLVVDHTGCGRPVVDMIREQGLDPVAVTITGGDAVSHDGPDFRVPKRDLVGALVVALQNNRLKIARSLPDAEILTAELLNFKVKINVKTAHDSYEAWREGQHDDLVLSVGLAVWTADYIYGHSEHEEMITYDPGEDFRISPV